ncbi:MAG TPA: DUF2934 domain-containing protein [Blastocatellia bacterium]|nr:DUF2934 domain-containing protein [Blastocatellia bacterium]
MTEGVNNETIEKMREGLLRDSEVQEMISMRAYDLYLARNSQGGSEVEDWLRAENEILTILIQEELRNRTAFSGAEVIQTGEATIAPRTRSGKKKPTLSLGESPASKSSKVNKARNAAPSAAREIEPESEKLKPPRQTRKKKTERPTPVADAPGSEAKAPGRKTRSGTKSTAQPAVRSKAESKVKPADQKKRAVGKAGETK